MSSDEELTRLESNVDWYFKCAKCGNKFWKETTVYSAGCGHSVCNCCYSSLPIADTTDPYSTLRFCLKCQGINCKREWFMDFEMRRFMVGFEQLKTGWHTKKEQDRKQLEDFQKVVSAFQDEMRLSQRLATLEIQADSMKCCNCEVLEKKDRMHICMQCAMLNGVKESAGVDEMKPFFTCSYCVLYVHKGHPNVVKYAPWEVRRLITASLEENIKFVESLDPYFVKMMEKRNGAFAEWLKNTRGEKKIDFETIKYREGLEICENMAKERDIVKKAIEKSMDEFDKYFASIEKPDSILEDANSEQEKTGN